MATTFDEYYQRAREAMEEREHAATRAACEAALAVATAPHERALALHGLADACFGEDDEHRALELLEQAIAACLPQPEQETPKDVATAYALGQSWYDKAIHLAMTRKEEEALAVLDELLRRSLDSATDQTSQSEWGLELRVVVARALGMKSSLLRGMERVDAALDCRAEVVRRFGTSHDHRLQRHVAHAMYSCAVYVGDLGRQDKEVAAYDELVARFDESEDLNIIEIVLEALGRKTRLYQDQEDHEMVIEVCDEIVRRYGDHTDWHVANEVARAIIRRAVALGKRGHFGKELAGYDEVVQRYGDSPVELLRRHAAKALMFKAVSLNDADQGAAEIECYEDVIRRYGEDPNAEVRVVAADALIHKGMSLGAIAEDAAEDTGVREVDAEIACYDDVVARYGNEDAIDLQRAVAEALLHKGETLAEASRSGEAARCLDQLIAAYAAIEDADLQEIIKEARELRADI
jgi:tetratricopeptide (TPR) repeat protein